MLKKQCFIKNVYFLVFIISLTSNIVADTDSGNWYEKLHWWKKAKPKYEEIQSLVIKVKEIKKELTQKRVSFLPNYEELFKDLQIEKNNIENKLNKLIDQYTSLLENDATEDDEQSQKNRVLYNKIKDDLNSIKLDFNMLNGLKSRLDEAVLKLLIEQYQQVDNFEEKALDDFDDIESVLDDKKARDLYEGIENSNDNIKAIYQYLDGALRHFINETIGKLKQLITNIKLKNNELKEQNIYISEAEEASVKEKEKSDLDLKQKQSKSVEPAKETSEEISFLGKVINFFKKIWSIIISPFVFLYNKFK